MNPQLIEMLRAQAGREMEAHNVYLALSLWAKTQGYAGSHKWFGRASIEERSHCKRFLKFLADYAGEAVSVPASEDQPCNAENLTGAYAAALALETQVTEALREISAYADSIDAMDAVSFVDDFLKDQVQAVKRLNRFMKILERAEGDEAALILFDKERK